MPANSLQSNDYKEKNQLTSEQAKHDEKTIRELMYYTNVFVLHDYFRSDPRYIDDRVVLICDYWFYYIKSLNFKIYDRALNDKLNAFWEVFDDIITEGGKYYVPSMIFGKYVFADGHREAEYNPDERAFFSKLTATLPKMYKLFVEFISLVKDKYVIDFENIDSDLMNSGWEEESKQGEKKEETINKDSQEQDKLFEYLVKKSEDPIEQLESSDNPSAQVFGISMSICNWFKHLVERNRLSEIVWRQKRTPDETDWQWLFYAVAESYRKGGNKDVAISKEDNPGVGKIDFHMTRGIQGNTVLEIKRSTNPELINGFKKQLPAYIKSVDAHSAIFVVILEDDSYKKISKELDEVQNDKEAMKPYEGIPYKIVYVNGMHQETASVRAYKDPSFDSQS